MFINTLKKININPLVIFFFYIAMLHFIQPGSAGAASFTRPEKIPVIMIGDRLVDVAYNLGVLPEAMVIRCAMWSLCEKIRTTSLPLGCPSCILKKKKEAVSQAMKKFNIKRIIIEKNPEYCLYKPEIRLEDIVSLINEKKTIIEYVDFSNGIESAIRQTAELLGRKDRASVVIGRYKKAMTRARSKLPVSGIKKRVVIINGVFQDKTGKTFLRVEMPGGYADRFLLKPMGCINTGNLMKPENSEVGKGHFLIRKLDALVDAWPDVIVMTGDALGVQQAVFDQVQKNPALKSVPAVKNNALFSLPRYVDSGVLEYPYILQKWVLTLSR